MNYIFSGIQSPLAHTGKSPVSKPRENEECWHVHLLMQ